MNQWVVAELSLQSPAFWLLVSVIVTLVLAGLLWRLQAGWVRWLWIGQWIAIPYAGLLLGGLSPRLMGFFNFDWVATLGLGSGLLLVILVLLAAVRATVELGEAFPSHSQRSEQSDADAVEKTNVPAWQLAALVIVLNGAEEFHWAFLRGALWEVLLTAPVPPALPAYWAVWIAAALVMLETALRRPSFEQWAVQISILATSSILFLYTRNFWLCWILHSAGTFILTTNGRRSIFMPIEIGGASR